MADFLLNQVAKMVMKPAVAPVLTQGRMQEILMHGREFTDQNFIQDTENALFRFHDYSHHHADPAIA